MMNHNNNSQQQQQQQQQHQQHQQHQSDTNSNDNNSNNEENDRMMEELWEPTPIGPPSTVQVIPIDPNAPPVMMDLLSISIENSISGETKDLNCLYHTLPLQQALQLDANDEKNKMKSRNKKKKLQRQQQHQEEQDDEDEDLEQEPPSSPYHNHSGIPPGVAAGLAVAAWRRRQQQQQQQRSSASASSSQTTTTSGVLSASSRTTTTASTTATPRNRRTPTPTRTHSYSEASILQWEERFQELKLFQTMTGRDRVGVASTASPQLKSWVRYQRRQLNQYRSNGNGGRGHPPSGSSSIENGGHQRSHTIITEERIRKLDSIGFDWEPQQRQRRTTTQQQR